MKNVRVVIEGLVQGVGFRAWLQREARKANLHGWVRNAGLGTVEALFSGDKAAVKHLVELCRLGPPAATVTEVSTHRAGEPDDPTFQILPAAS